MTFDQFVQHYMDEADTVSDIGRTYRFVMDNDGKTGVDYIFRYENLAAYTKFLESKFERTLELEHRNRSPALDFTLSKKLKTQIEEFLMPEYEIYETARSQ